MICFLADEWVLPYFNKKKIYAYCVKVMKERRKQVRNGHDYNQVSAQVSVVICILKACKLACVE